MSTSSFHTTLFHKWHAILTSFEKLWYLIDLLTHQYFSIQTAPHIQIIPISLKAFNESSSARAHKNISTDMSSKSNKPSSIDGAPSSTPTFEDGTPRSVRNVPTELRSVVRRRQNTENARNLRERQRAEMEYMEDKYAENKKRIDKLEKTVGELTAELLESNDSRGSNTKRKEARVDTFEETKINSKSGNSSAQGSQSRSMQGTPSNSRRDDKKSNNFYGEPF